MNNEKLLALLDTWETSTTIARVSDPAHHLFWNGQSNVYERLRKVIADEEKAKLHCEECGAPVRNLSPEGVQPEDGLVLNLSGHYGGFTDFLEEDEAKYVLCHDCCAMLLQLFPNIGIQMKNTHPYEGEEPCCPWGWTTR